MKKSILALGVALAAVSCNINDPKPFDDADAFAAFSTTSLTVSEDGSKVSIPVHLTSLSGVATSVSYTVKDGSAVQGTNFTVSGGSGVLTFAAGECDKTIDFDIINNPGVFTGDLSFSVELTSAGDVKLGASTTAKVTITDLDHPLSFILGTYTGHFVSYFDGTEYDGEISFEKNPSDVSMLWVNNLDPFFAENGYVAPKANRFYANVSEDKHTITIPVGQDVGYTDTTLESGDDLPIVLTVSEDGKTITIESMFGTADPEGFWEAYLGGVVLTKVE